MRSPSLLMTALWLMMPPPSIHAGAAVAECGSRGTVAEQLSSSRVVFVGDVTAIRRVRE